MQNGCLGQKTFEIDVIDHITSYCNDELLLVMQILCIIKLVTLDSNVCCLKWLSVEWFKQMNKHMHAADANMH